MKLFALAAVAAILSISATSHAESFAKPYAATITGEKAQKLMIDISNNPSMKVVENTVGITVLSLEDRATTTECTLIGAHAGSPMADSPMYSCQISSIYPTGDVMPN